jgi:DNA-binding response OmpR family regulator
MTFALLVEDMLVQLGHEVVAMAMRLGQAQTLAKSAEIDFAILDVNLDGRMSFPVAEVLEERGVPYVFATGYGSAGVEPQFRNRGMVMKKPFDTNDLREAIERLTA